MIVTECVKNDILIKINDLYTLMEVNIIKLVEKNPLTRLSNDYQSKFINKIKDSFTEEEQQLFLSSFYCYLNYDQKKDFVIEFDSTWKWLGFSRKEECKRVLTKHFIENINYKIDTRGFTPIGVKGGRPKESILLTVNTLIKFRITIKYSLFN
jgi:hypothetical protein